MDVLLFILWPLFAIVVGVGAANRGRNGLAWGLLAIILTPLLAAFLLVVLGSKRNDSKQYGPAMSKQIWYWMAAAGVLFVAIANLDKLL